MQRENRRRALRNAYHTQFYYYYEWSTIHLRHYKNSSPSSKHPLITVILIIIALVLKEKRLVHFVSSISRMFHMRLSLIYNGRREGCYKKCAKV